MSSWTDARAYLRRSGLRLKIADPDLIGVEWTVRGPSGPIQQRQLISAVTAFGVEYLQIMSLVASANALSPLDALVKNSELLIGSVCLIDNTYVVRAILPLENLDTVALDRTLRVVANEAARLGARTPRAAAPYYE
ncbi:MAG: hypothetical protein ACKV2T_43990 [Kofleriaceae bacterium]